MIYLEVIMKDCFKSGAGDGVPIEEWANEFMHAARLSGKAAKPQGNRVWIARKRGAKVPRRVVCIRPEARWACHEQDEVERKPYGGPNPFVVQRVGMTCGKEWKANRTW